MPVIAVAPRNDMLDKLKANLQEVKARGGELFVFAEKLHLSSTTLPPINSADCSFVLVTGFILVR